MGYAKTCKKRGDTWRSQRKKKIIGTHEGPKERKKKYGHMKVQVYIKENDEHMKAHVRW
jgi:hypothetical protein